MQRGAVPLQLTVWQRLLVSMVVAAGLVGIIAGLVISSSRSTTSGLPAAIEGIRPARGAQAVPAQTDVFVDLADGYTGVLTIDGVELTTFDLSTQTELGSVSSIPATLPAPEPGSQAVLPKGVTYFDPGNATLTYAPTPGAPVEKFDARQHLVVVRYWKVVDGPSSAHTFAWQFTVF